MPKPASRDVKKRLFEFAKNEYESKSPRYVEVRRAKAIRKFYHGPVPKFILTRHKPLLYTVFAHYGTLGRLYHFNRQGYCVKDTSYSEQQLDQLLKHLKKTSTRIIKYPKVQEKPSVIDRCVELDNQFTDILEEIEKIIDRPIKARPVITLASHASTSKDNWFRSLKPQGKFIQVPRELENDPKISILLTREAFFIAIYQILPNNRLAFDLSMLGTLFFIKDRVLREDALQAWPKPSWSIKPFSTNHQYCDKEIKLLFELIADLKTFSDTTQLSNEQQITLLIQTLYNEIGKKSDAKERLAKFFQEVVHLKLKENQPEVAANYLLQSVFAEFLSKTADSISSNTLKLSKKIQKVKPTGKLIFRYSHYLRDLKIKAFYDNWRNNQRLFPNHLDEVVNLVFDEAFRKAIVLTFTSTTSQIDKPGDLQLILENQSDASLGTLRIEDLSWNPKNALEIIGERSSWKSRVLKPGENILFKLPILPKKSSKVHFNPIQLKFNDPFAVKHYIRISLPSLTFSDN
ncbi:MAG: hypothetical protein GF308_17275 [Candidatus Heimdallarchaeota archaeon]|nr:hypothetical protein [Candidatus Heimdallarchaeota archaeon]